MNVDLSRLDSVHCREDGAVTLAGPLLAHFHRLDRLFSNLVLQDGGRELRFPDHLPISAMQRTGYLDSFPHLATFLAPLSGQELRRGSTTGLPVEASRLEAPTLMLAPAACYHAYLDYQGSELADPQILTTCGTCYRNEPQYLPLQRQRSFSMRELICIGSAPEVEAFVDRLTQRLRMLLAQLHWNLEWAAATDPFFDPEGDPRHLAQRLGALKTELRHEGLALCSINHHGTYFGEAFSIQRAGHTAHSACIAFGLERWLFAFASHHGPDVSQWPIPDGAD